MRVYKYNVVCIGSMIINYNNTRAPPSGYRFWVPMCRRSKYFPFLCKKKKKTLVL